MSDNLNQGSALGSQSHETESQSQIFGIGIWVGIDFSEFWDWDWDRFFRILGLGLELGSIFLKFGIGIGLGITNSGQNPKKSQESQEIPKVFIKILDNFKFHQLLIFFRIKVCDWKPLFQRPRGRDFILTNDCF